MDILILSALEKNERQILLQHLSNVQDIKHPQTGTDYYEGIYKGGGKTYTVALAKTDQTNVNAGIETERAIAYYKPNHVFFVGVAGGLKDVKIGDVVIGQDVYGYERGKSTSVLKGKKKKAIFEPRPKFGLSSYALEKACTSFSHSPLWKNLSASLVNTDFGEGIEVFTGTIAAGEKVDASIDSDLHSFLKANCGHALAIEMEGLGFLEACRAYPQIQSLLIRGISDMVDDKHRADKKGGQEYATKNAAAFLFAFIETIGLKILNQTRIEKLVDILCKLYPGGVKDARVWIRAGGDLSRLQLSSSGMEQWIDAMELIENGGTDVEIGSLLEVIRKDFPKNSFLSNF